MLRSNVMLCYNTAKQIYRIRNVNIKYLLYKSLPIAHRISKNTFCLLAPMSNLILFCQHLFCGVRSCKPLHFANQILLMFVKNFFLEVAQKKGRTK